MTHDDLIIALRARFDAGEELTPELRVALAESPEAGAYWRRLKRLDRALWGLPLESPPPGLVMRLQQEVARDREARFWNRTAIGATAVALIAAALFAGWRYPQYASPDAWWYAASEYLPEQAWLENTTPLDVQVAQFWDLASRAWEYPLAPSWGVSLAALAVSVFVLVGFNAAGARRLRVAGTAHAHRAPHTR